MRIAVPITGSEASSGRFVEALKQGMREQGYLDGEVVYDVEYASGQIERFDGIVQRLLSMNPDVIVLAGPALTRLAMNATGTVPIVMANTSNAVGNKFVTSLARPGGNVTGITTLYEDLLGKVCESLHELVPGAKRLAVLLNETNPSHEVFWESSKKGLNAFGKIPLRLAVNKPENIETTFRSLQGLNVQAAVVVVDFMFLTFREKIAALALGAGLRTAFGTREHVDAGGLFSYGPSLSGNFRQSSRFIARILKGAKPGELPVEQPTVFEFVINRKTARKLGISIPQPVLLRADQVIE